MSQLLIFSFIRAVLLKNIVITFQELMEAKKIVKTKSHTFIQNTLYLNHHCCNICIKSLTILYQIKEIFNINMIDQTYFADFQESLNQNLIYSVPSWSPSSNKINSDKLPGNLPTQRELRKHLDIVK